MSQATAVIAENETVLRDELRSHLTALWPELRVVGEARNGFEALQLLERLQPALVFLDVQMPGMNGLEVARALGGACHVVFVTAYNAHAVAAFEQGAVDYLLKPYSIERLAMTVHRLRQRLDGAPASLEKLLPELTSALPARAYLRWINAAKGQEVSLITVDEVVYFQSDFKYTRVVTAEGAALIRKSLKELQEELDPACFWLIHRSTIVNANAIAGVLRDFRGHVMLRLKSRAEKLQVSEAHTHLFRQM